MKKRPFGFGSHNPILREQQRLKMGKLTTYPSVMGPDPPSKGYVEFLGAPPNDQAEKLLPKRQLRLANAKSVKARWVGSPAKVTLNGGEKQGKCPPKIPETFRFRNHTNLPRGWTLLLFWFIFVARWGQETRYKWGEMGPLYKL